MPKLLSLKETKEIAAKMTAEYGLPPPRIISDSYTGMANLNVKVEIVRSTNVRLFDRFSWPTWRVFAVVRHFYAFGHEEILVKLQQELSRFCDDDAKIAEQFREKYALEEANEALDEVLRKK